MSKVDELIQQLQESTGIKKSHSGKSTGGGRAGSDEYYGLTAKCGWITPFAEG